MECFVLGDVYVYEAFDACGLLDGREGDGFFGGVVGFETEVAGVGVGQEGLVFVGLDGEGVGVDAVEAADETVVDESHFCSAYSVLVILLYTILVCGLILSDVDYLPCQSRTWGWR